MRCDGSVESREEKKEHEEKNGGTTPPPQDCRELQEEGNEPYDAEAVMEERLEEGRAAAEIIFWDIANCTGTHTRPYLPAPTLFSLSLSLSLSISLSISLSLSTSLYLSNPR